MARISRYFEVYIQRVMKYISHNRSITLEAKQHLNTIMCQIAHVVSKTAIEIVEKMNKTTITEKVVETAISTLLNPRSGSETQFKLRSDLSGILENSISEGNKSVRNYENLKNITGSQSKRAGIVFSPTISIKFLKLNKEYRVSKKASIYLASVLEYITADILQSAIVESSKVRITKPVLNTVILTDVECIHLWRIFNLNNLKK